MNTTTALRITGFATAITALVALCVTLTQWTVAASITMTAASNAFIALASLTVLSTLAWAKAMDRDERQAFAAYLMVLSTMDLEDPTYY